MLGRKQITSKRPWEATRTSQMYNTVNYFTPSFFAHTTFYPCLLRLSLGGNNMEKIWIPYLQNLRQLWLPNMHFTVQTASKMPIHDGGGRGVRKDFGSGIVTDHILLLIFCTAGVKAGYVHLCWVVGNTVWCWLGLWPVKLSPGWPILCWWRR